MNYFQARDTLGDPDLKISEIFGILKVIAQHVNDKDRERYAQGRDLIIRALARHDLCGDFESRILTSLVRSVGLYPYMTDTLQHAEIDDRLAYELHRADGMTEVFHSLQAKIYYQLKAGSNVVLSAATSVGKSLLIDAMISLGKFKKIVIIVPTLALIDETRKRLARRFSGQCHLITHMTQVADPDRVNVYILTQERVRKRIDLGNVEFFVVDEFYKLDLRHDDDQQRAVDLNLAFHQLASAGAQFYLLGPNVEAIRGLDRYEIHFIPSEYSTVAVDVVHFNLPKFGDDRPSKLASLCQTLDSPTLIYCSGPMSASRVANQLLRDVMPDTRSSCADAAAWVAENFHPEWVVAKALAHGVGLHHGGIPRSLQQYMVKLFDEGALKFLVCTSTLIEGVNTAAENVVIYDRRRSTKTLDFFTYKNIQGRAGRMGRYFIGKVFVFEAAPPDDEMEVDYPVGTQDEETPLSLLMQLDEEDLTPLSKARVEEALQDSFLSVDTIRANGSVAPGIQNQIAREIYAVMQDDPEAFSWNGIPGQAHLLRVCELIMRHLSGQAMNRNGITSPSGLAWHLRALADRDGVKGYLAQVAENKLEHQDLSKEIDSALKIMRNVAGFRFPQDLMVIHSIQGEIARRLEVRPGNYGPYAEMIENHFMPPLIAALEEYGLPLQIARKLISRLEPAYELDTVIGRLRNLEAESIEELTAFERSMLNFVQVGL